MSPSVVPRPKSTTDVCLVKLVGIGLALVGKIVNLGLKTDRGGDT